MALSEQGRNLLAQAIEGAEADARGGFIVEGEYVLVRGMERAKNYTALGYGGYSEELVQAWGHALSRYRAKYAQHLPGQQR